MPKHEFRHIISSIQDLIKTKQNKKTVCLVGFTRASGVSDVDTLPVAFHMS